MRKDFIFLIIMSLLFMYACSKSNPAGPEMNQGVTPLPLFPENNSTITNLTIKLVVRNANGFDGAGSSYKFQIATDSNFNHIIFDKEIPGGISSTSLPLTTNLSGGTSYYWHARAHKSTSWTDYSVTFVFMIQSFATPPEPVAPLEEEIIANDTLLLRVRTSPYFSAADDIYRFEIFKVNHRDIESRNNLFPDRVPQNPGATLKYPHIIIKEVTAQPNFTQVAINPPLSEGTYSWRARAYHTHAGAEESTLYTNTIKFYAADNCNHIHNGRWAFHVIENHVTCGQFNFYQNALEALGAPNATPIGPHKFTGFVSLGMGGFIIVEMGECIHDGPGYDLAIFQTAAAEGVGVEVAPTPEGPWRWLGWKPCGNPSTYYSNVCYFDLAEGPLSWGRYVKIIDYERGNMPDYAYCELDGIHPGADIDAAEVLH